jgi:cell division protein FtsB
MDMSEKIYALQQDKYEQRKEIAQYRRQEIELLREIARLKTSLVRKSTVPIKSGVTQRRNS